MYLHLGQDYIVNTQDLIGIFDIDTASVTQAGRDFLSRAEKEGAMVTLSSDLPRSFVVTDFPGDTVYVSPLSPTTLKRRAGGYRAVIQKKDLFYP